MLSLSKSDTESFTVVPAFSPVERAEVYRLRFNAYKEPTPEFAGPGPGMNDYYDDQPNCTSSLLVTPKGQPVGSIRPCVYSPAFNYLPVPVFGVFAEETRERLGCNAALVQSTHFVLDAEYRSFQLRHKLLLFREVLRTALNNNIAHIATVVRNTESMASFYSRIGLFQVGKPKMHPNVHREAILLVAETAQMFSLCQASRVFQPMIPDSAPASNGVS